MSDELFHELVAQFAETLPEKSGNDFSGTIGAIHLKNTMKKEKQCGVFTRSSLRCTMLDQEIKESVFLEKKILEFMTLLIQERDTEGDTIVFTSHDGALATSSIYLYIKKLYILRYGVGEGERLDTAFAGNKKNTEARLIIEYSRHKKFEKTDMAPSNFFIKRLYLRYSESMD